MISWRSLFDAIQVPWRDRGANTSRGHVNIKCPMCADDPSHHLAINEDNGAYYCYRARKEHAGRSLPWLLMKLGVHSDDIDSLIVRFSIGPPDLSHALPPRNQREPQRSLSTWDRLRPVRESPQCLEYLESRGFSKPELVADLFNLRFAPTGPNAQRLFFPLSDRYGNIIGFTGRGLRAGIEPRYYTETSEQEALYKPLQKDLETRYLLLVEGPMDALKCAAGLWNFDRRRLLLPIRPVAILGLGLTHSKLMHLRDLAKGRDVLLSLDVDQSALRTSLHKDSRLQKFKYSGIAPASVSLAQFRDELRTAGKELSAHRRLELPEGSNDQGAIKQEDIAPWLIQALTSQHGQGAASRYGASGSFGEISGV